MHNFLKTRTDATPNMAPGIGCVVCNRFWTAFARWTLSAISNIRTTEEKNNKKKLVTQLDRFMKFFFKLIFFTLDFKQFYIVVRMIPENLNTFHVRTPEEGKDHKQQKQ